MAPRPGGGDERRNEILDRAEDVFIARGLHQTRMDDIVAASGLSKGAIYWYFKKKDDIITAVLRRIFQRSLQRLQSFTGAGESATARLLQAGDAVLEDFNEMQKFMGVAYDFYAMALRRRVVRKFIAGFYREYRDLLAPIIREGIASGEFRAVDPEATAVILVSLFEGMGLVWAIEAPLAAGTPLVQWETSGRLAMSLLLEGLKAGGPRPGGKR